jgi:hypothetical protein
MRNLTNCPVTSVLEAVLKVLMCLVLLLAGKFRVFSTSTECDTDRMSKIWGTRKEKRERETERQRDNRETDRERQTERDRETEERNRETERHRERDNRERERERESERERHRERHSRERQRQRETERQRQREKQKQRERERDAPMRRNITSKHYMLKYVHSETSMKCLCNDEILISMRCLQPYTAAQEARKHETYRAYRDGQHTDRQTSTDRHYFIIWFMFMYARTPLGDAC